MSGVVYMCVCACVFACICLCVMWCVSRWMCVCALTYACVCSVCVYVYTNTHVCVPCVLIPKGNRWSHCILWCCSSIQLWAAWLGCLESTFSALDEHRTQQTDESFLQPQRLQSYGDNFALLSLQVQMLIWFKDPYRNKIFFIHISVSCSPLKWEKLALPIHFC